MKIHLLSFVLLFIPFCLFSQAGRFDKSCELAREIAIGESGIQAVSKIFSDTLVTDVQMNAFLYSVPDSLLSFWYKIYADVDCKITFDIYPSLPGNTYNYFLYKIPDELTICDIKPKKTPPLRANLFTDEMYMTGTGLSLSSTITYYDTASITRVKDFYHTPYHAAVQAKKGDIFFLNIYHMTGKDCGFHFTLRDGLHAQKFQTVYKTCYTEQLKISKTKTAVNLYTARSLPAAAKPIAGEVIASQKPAVKGEMKAVFIIRDSLRHATVDAEIYWVKHKNPNPSIFFKESGKYELVLEKNTGYQLVFSAVGYKKSEIFFLTTDSLRSFSNIVYLQPYQQGDNFVMDKIYFYPNTYSLKPGALDEIDKLITYLKANPGVSIEIQGHTSGNKRIRSSGNEREGSFSGSAKKLSQLRAAKIKAYLEANGISEERLTANGYGGSQMIYPKPRNQMEANKNIRVQIQILSRKDVVLSSTSRK